jgi:antitoxin component YwqK of YwqJK toxin-antitoxin module
MNKDTVSLFRISCREFILKKDLPDGTYYIIKSKNDTCAIHNLKNNKYNGRQIWFQETNKQEFKKLKTYRYALEEYDNGFLQKKIFYSENGLKTSETNYINGIKNGKETIFKDTKISAINHFENDSLRDWKLYYGNGKIKAEGWGDFTYRQNSLNEYEEDGTIKRVISFKNGVPINYILFYKNGILKEIGYIDIYEEDVREAFSRGYTNKTKFVNNNKFEKIIFDPTGKKLN